MWNGSRESKNGGGDLLRGGRGDHSVAEVPSADRSRTDGQGSSSAQCGATGPREQGSIQKEQLGMWYPLRVSGNM